MNRVIYAAVLMLLWTVPLAAQTAAAPDDCPWPGPPQFLDDRPSLPDSTMVRVGNATIKLCYSRPVARGRVIFGELVPFDRLWRTGANEPTMLHLPVAARVAGVALERGAYLLFTVPGKDSWSVVLSTSDAATPMDMLNDNTEVGRGTVPAEPLDEYVEVLTISGADHEGGAVLILDWERTRIRIPIELRD